MVVIEPDRLVGQGVEVGGLDDWVSRATEVAVSLVIGDHQNHVGLLCCQAEAGDKDEKQCEKRFH